MCFSCGIGIYLMWKFIFICFKTFRVLRAEIQEEIHLEMKYICYIFVQNI